MLTSLASYLLSPFRSLLFFLLPSIPTPIAPIPFERYELSDVPDDVGPIKVYVGCGWIKEYYYMKRMKKTGLLQSSFNRVRVII